MTTLCPYCRAPGTRLRAQAARGPASSWACGTASFGGRPIQGEACKFRVTIADLRSGLEEIRAIIDLQTADKTLWAEPQTPAEAQLQQELRRLHAAASARATDTGLLVRRAG